MKKIVNTVSISAVILFGTLNAAAQNNSAVAVPKVEIGSSDIIKAKSSTTDAGSAADRTKNSNMLTPAPLPEGGKAMIYQKNTQTAEEVYRGEEKITVRPETLSRSPLPAPLTQKLNQKTEVAPKPTPKVAVVSKKE